jgi:hypothetical protein
MTNSGAKRLNEHVKDVMEINFIRKFSDETCMDEKNVTLEYM